VILEANRYDLLMMSATEVAVISDIPDEVQRWTATYHSESY